MRLYKSSFYISQKKGHRVRSHNGEKIRDATFIAILAGGIIDLN